MDFSNIPIVILFILALASSIVSNNYKAYYVKKTMEYESEQYSFNAGASIVCALLLFLMNGCSLTISAYSLWMGIVYGIVTMGHAILTAKAIKVGPYCYTTVIVSLSTGVTALSGQFYGMRV